MFHSTRTSSATVPATARSPLRLAAAAVLALGLAGCESISNLNPFGGEKYETRLLPDVSGDQVYDQGLARLQRRDYPGAATKFEELEKQFPFTQYSRRGLVMVAYSNYEGGRYDEAAIAARRYVSLYPSTDDTPYMMYIAAMSQYNQIPDITRDQEKSQNALRLFQELIDKYPKSEYTEDAKYKVQVARDQLAGKEMSVGRFYLGRRNYNGAINRFRGVLSNYQTTRHAEEALYRLVEAYLGLGIAHEAQTAAAVLGHNFPDGQWYKDAFARLQGQGLQPQNHPGSWLTGIFRRATASAG